MKIRNGRVTRSESFRVQAKIEGMIGVDCGVEGRPENFGVSGVSREFFLDFSGVS